MKKASENPYKKLEDTIVMESVLNPRHLNVIL